jgi:transcription factor 7-like 2
MVNEEDYFNQFFYYYLDCLNPKKCRARYGLEGVSQWCKHCRRKKKCTRFREDDKSLNPSSVSSSTTLHSDNEDSMNEPDSDDILSRQIDSIEDEHDDSNEENKQESYPPSSSQFPSKFHY